MERHSPLIVLSALLLGSMASAQQTGPYLGPRIVNVMPVVFTVTDTHGKFVNDLKPDQFKVLDKDRPTKIIAFEAQTNLPLRVGLLIDAANPLPERLLLAQRESAEFMRAVIRPESDQGFVLSFDEVPDVTQDFTNDLAKLSAGIRMIRPGRGVALWDAVYFACRDKMMRERNSTTVRRVIVVVSDGADDQSRVLRKEAIEMAQRAGVIIYTISTNPGKFSDSGVHNLQALADATGGRAFYPDKPSDVADDFRKIQNELSSQYFIVYKPADFEYNGQFHPIQIIPQGQLAVRVTKGYFAPTNSIPPQSPESGKNPR